MGRPSFSDAACAIVLFFSMISATVTQAQSTSAAPFPGTQSTFVGVYINDVYELDLKKSTYIADFYVWLRWQGEIDPTNIEFLNGSLDLKENPDNREASGTKYVSYHCRGTFHAVFDYRRYPLDEHLLALEMEDGHSESTKLQYVVDFSNMSRLPAVRLAGWTCDPPKFEVREHTYETNFGDPTRAADGTAVYSRLSCTIRVSHRSFSIYVKTFLALFISVGIAFLSFMLKPGETDPRFGVGLAAIFGAVSSEIVLSSNLPDMPYLTLADKIHLFSFFVIFLSLLQSCLTLRLVRQGKSALAARIDRVSLIAFPICYAVVVAILTVVH
jgi:hypothetical protein